MTKDRRLGRGLAALLGTPLEEEGGMASGATMVVDEADGRRNSAAPRLPRSDSPAGNSGPAASPSARVDRSAATERLGSASSPSSSPATSGHKATAGSSRATPSTAGTPTTTAAAPPDRIAADRAAADRNSGKRSESSSATSAPAATPESFASTTVEALEIDVSQIDNNPFQPRRRFNETEIAALAESIREHAQLQPILVRRVGQRYQLISGERRLRATIHAGLTKIRAEVREADDRLVAELAIVENLQRKDLDPIEKALSFRRYINEHQCAQEDLARRLKIDRSTIANLMRLLELPAELQNHVQNGKLSSGHARTLLPLGDEEEQLAFARQIMDEGWTVRETERRVAAHLLEQDQQNKPRANKLIGPRKRETPHLAALEQELRGALGTKAEIRQQKTGRGKIVINFNNPQEFERLYGLLCPHSAQRAA